MLELLNLFINLKELSLDLTEAGVKTPYKLKK